jgi:hypothetical protein
MNKQEVLDTIKNIKNVPIEPQKKDLHSNSSGTNHKALMRYNAMLDNITIGAHTQKMFTLNGIEWTFRLLTGHEQNSIRKEVMALAKKDECFEDFNLKYLEMIKIVTKALSPSPFKTDGKEIWSEEDVGMLPYAMLEEMFNEYIEFDLLAMTKPSDLPIDEVEALIEIIKKKPEALKEFERKKLLATSLYLLNYCNHLEKITKSVTSN